MKRFQVSPKFYYLLMLTAALNLNCGTKSKQTANLKTESVEAPQPVTDSTSARNAAIGTWTGKIILSNGVCVWARVVIDSSLRATNWERFVTENSWGTPRWTGVMSLRTSKYIDTGKRYYYLDAPLKVPYGSFEGAMILVSTEDAGWNEYSTDGGKDEPRIPLVKRDTFPFSP